MREVKEGMKRERSKEGSKERRELNESTSRFYFPSGTY